jgi:hypothetical protein
MKIPFKNSMIVAQKVIDSLNIQIDPKLVKDLSIEAYSNGREQGYCIDYFPKKKLLYHKICISENRNSDDIVIYKGKYTDFDITGNIPSEIVYSSAIYFLPNEISQAANHIIQYIKEINANI